MTISFKQLHPTFVGEAGPVDLALVKAESELDQVRAAMDQ